MGWTKKQLEAQGYRVDNPFLRDGYKSDYEGWKRGIEKLDINENTILVGWSSGGAFWVRYLGETKQKVKKLILVAPSKVVGNSEESLKKLWLIQTNENQPAYKSEWDSFHDFKCDTTIKDRVDDVTIFISNDVDWLVDASHIYAKELDAKLIEIKNQGHFTIDRRPSPEFPELLDAILQ
jgi:predicted alpha/beta hydrolase family esterase